MLLARSPTDFVTPPIRTGIIRYFGGGALYPPGVYRLSYAGGAMQYNGVGSVFAVADPFTAGNGFWFRAPDADVEAFAPQLLTPGGVGRQYDTAAECRTAHRSAPPVDLWVPTASRLGVLLRDTPLGDNLASALGSPTFTLLLRPPTFRLLSVRRTSSGNDMYRLSFDRPWRGTIGPFTPLNSFLRVTGQPGDAVPFISTEDTTQDGGTSIEVQILDYNTPSRTRAATQWSVIGDVGLDFGPGQVLNIGDGDILPRVVSARVADPLGQSVRIVLSEPLSDVSPSSGSGFSVAGLSWSPMNVTAEGNNSYLFDASAVPGAEGGMTWLIDLFELSLIGEGGELLQPQNRGILLPYVAPG